MTHTSTAQAVRVVSGAPQHDWNVSRLTVAARRDVCSAIYCAQKATPAENIVNDTALLKKMYNLSGDALQQLLTLLKLLREAGADVQVSDQLQAFLDGRDSATPTWVDIIEGHCERDDRDSFCKSDSTKTGAAYHTAVHVGLLSRYRVIYNAFFGGCKRTVSLDSDNDNPECHCVAKDKIAKNLREFSDWVTRKIADLVGQLTGSPSVRIVDFSRGRPIVTTGLHGAVQVSAERYPAIII